MKQMNRKIGVGVAWNLASLLLSRGASIIFMLFLARLLAPESFGLIAMMMIVLELGQHFVQSGLGQALIRSRSVSDADLSTVFHSNLGISALVYGMLYAGAPYLAAFYDQVELTGLLRVMGLVVFLNALQVVPVAILSREMRFRPQMIARTSAVGVAGVVAVFMAWLGAGVWSLVAQSLMTAGITALLLWRATRWAPALVFSKESFGRLFGFGANLLAIGTVRILVQNSYVMVIGRAFSAEVTGLYFVARKISELISKQLSQAVQKATFPAMATLQDDNAQLRYKYRQIIQLMMFVIAPVMALMGALAEPMFSVVLGEKWNGAVVYFQMLCVVATLYPLHAMNINVLNVKGRSDLVLKIGLLKNAINLSFLFAMLPFGVFWIVVGQIGSSFIALVPNTYFTARLIDYGITAQLADIAKPVGVSAVGGFAAFGVVQILGEGGVLPMMLGGAFGCAVLLGAAHLTGVEGWRMLLKKGKGYMARA